MTPPVLTPVVPFRVVLPASGATRPPRDRSERARRAGGGAADATGKAFRGGRRSTRQANPHVELLGRSNTLWDFDFGCEGPGPRRQVHFNIQYYYSAAALALSVHGRPWSRHLLLLRGPPRLGRRDREVLLEVRVIRMRSAGSESVPGAPERVFRDSERTASKV